MKMNEIEKQFPNYTVIAVDGENVALISENGTPHLTTCSKVGDEIVIGAKAEAKTTTVFEAGEVNMSFATDAVIERLNARCIDLQKKNEELEKERKSLSETVQKMQTAEKARRKEACRLSVKNRLAEINKNRKVKIEEDICNSLLTDEKLDYFSAMEDCDGKFIGDENAIRELDSLCMAEIIKADEMIAVNNQKRFPWEVIPGEGGEATDLQKLADRLESNIE